MLGSPTPAKQRLRLTVHLLNIRFTAATARQQGVGFGVRCWTTTEVSQTSPLKKKAGQRRRNLKKGNDKMIASVINFEEDGNNDGQSEQREKCNHRSEDRSCRRGDGVAGLQGNARKSGARGQPRNRDTVLLSMLGLAKKKSSR